MNEFSCIAADAAIRITNRRTPRMHHYTNQNLHEGVFQEMTFVIKVVLVAAAYWVTSIYLLNRRKKK